MATGTMASGRPINSGTLGDVEMASINAIWNLARVCTVAQTIGLHTFARWKRGGQAISLSEDKVRSHLEWDFPMCRSDALNT
eukprot:CAMPEP_0201998134 /NCGR_PEP_ID=MMETSP0905-20130828/4971_1 /ASSEMBLY_ACC=CAM_ASM_000554 /TAXON_ID=420261 /ORGANISM="Thalassiosira antarctica, Strain CCMP982" /LENGTH=81 /DNA_ID=CAMNT_0048554013 /DNA_START=335 /DNA_END=580 /DNA_ORIENTATION=-